MIPSLYVLGTDTNVGKTRVASLLLLLASEQGQVGACKPVATGASWVMDSLVSPDTEALRAAAGGRQSSREVTPFIFEPPLAAWTAARRVGSTLSARDLAASVTDVARRRGRVIAEGAGGVHVPLNETETQLDAVVSSGLPVVLVAAARLGCINQTLLSLEALKVRGVRVPLVYLNICDPQADTEVVASSLEEISSRVQPVALLPFAASLPAAVGGLRGALAGLGWVSP
ncbi:MAG: dethiobiotin synthase [Planctomycetota bacterium]